MQSDNGIKRFYRSPDKKVFAGVCGGLEEYFRVDASIFRILFVVSTLFGGFGIVTYLIMWLVVPKRQ